MKFAFFSDIHANLPALEAVLSDMNRRSIDMRFCLGDLVGYAPWPNEVVGMIRARGIPALAGNYDEGVGLNSDDCGCAYNRTRIGLAVIRASPLRTRQSRTKRGPIYGACLVTCA